MLPTTSRWDGTGYGPDGTVWGGEFLLITEKGWRRVGQLHPFRLSGGDAGESLLDSVAVAVGWHAVLEPPNLGRGHNGACGNRPVSRKQGQAPPTCRYA